MDYIYFPIHVKNFNEMYVFLIPKCNCRNIGSFRLDDILDWNIYYLDFNLILD